MAQPKTYGTSNNPNTDQVHYKDDQLEITKKKVDEVTNIMKDNVQNMVNRGAKLEDLESQANNLSEGASQFQTTSRNLKRKMWWKNLKMMLIIGAVVLVVIIVIIIAVVPKSGGGGGSSTSPTAVIASIFPTAEEQPPAINSTAQST